LHGGFYNPQAAKNFKETLKPPITETLTPERVKQIKQIFGAGA
jgi:dTDP-4-amino-4,6-dideoxygalactose transaminase